MSVDKAAAALADGGVIAYPTEGVFGLGCLPDNLTAVQRILDIKQRDVAKGLILIGANAAQFDAWVDLPDGTLFPALIPGQSITWIVPASHRVERLVRGDNDGIAVRITTNEIASAICTAAASPIVSTSANLSGEDVAEDASTLHRQFASLVDYVVPGECGPSNGPSEIRVLETGQVLRPTAPSEQH